MGRPVGAIALFVTAPLYAFSLLVRRVESPLTRREGAGLAVFVIPIAALLMFPHAQLGSFAASRKETGGFFLAAKPPVPASPKDVSFLDIHVAEGDPVFATEAGIEAGLRVRLLGLVTAAEPGRRSFELARFYISCCVADALPVPVSIDAERLASAPAVGKDDWLEVVGTLRSRDGGFFLEAERVRTVPRPAHPYLSFASR